MTDEAVQYKNLRKDFRAAMTRVNHKAEEYVRGEVTTNTVEGYFSVFKRGMKGIYQHCKEKHLHRYLNEFDFRFSNRIALGVNDVARADRALKGVVGKRLTYRTTSQLRGHMAKAGTPKKKKAKPKLSDKEQSERFKQTARELGVDQASRPIPWSVNHRPYGHGLALAITFQHNE